MTHKTTSMYILIGVLAPGAVMYGARFIGQAPASVQAEQFEVLTPRTNNFTDTVLLSHVDIMEPGKSEVVQSPFWFDVEDYNTVVNPFEGMLETQPFPQEPEAQIVVSTILPSSKNPLAVINSKPCRIGDDIEGGWKLIGIDGDTRTVLLLHESGKKKSVGLTKKKNSY